MYVKDEILTTVLILTLHWIFGTSVLLKAYKNVG